MSNMIDELIRNGIKLRDYSVRPHKTTCPRCSHTRKDKKDPCLWVNIKESNLAMWKCHNCVWTGSAGDVSHGAREEEQRHQRREYRKPEPVTVTSSMPANMVKFITDRGISPEVIKRNRLYHDGNKICFPYYVNGEMVNVKYRTVDKRFSMVQGARLTFYGLDDVRDAEEVIIVEGEFDKLALEMCGITNVISVPNGAPARIKETKEDEPLDNHGQFEYLIHAEALLKRAKRVVLAVDMDAPGKNLQTELARRIGVAKCFTVEWPEKDANDTLQKLGSDIVLDCIRDAQPLPIKGLYDAGDFEDTLLEYFMHGMSSGVSTGWCNVDALYTVKVPELDVVTGIPNSGKSEWLAALMVNIAKAEGWTFAIFSPEHGKEQLMANLVEKIVGLPTSPKAKNRMSAEQFMDGAAWARKYFKLIVADDHDSMPTLDWILQRASDAVYRYGIRGLVIDPWNEVMLPESAKHVSDTDHIGHCIARVKRWGRLNNVKPWIVAHPAKISPDKDGKIRVPGLYDIHGSAHWVNKPDNGIIIHRSADASDSTEFHTKKIRDKHVGRRGNCLLKYDRATGLYSVPDTKVAAAEDEDNLNTYDFGG